jgi:hypothetical protein
MEAYPEGAPVYEDADGNIFYQAFQIQSVIYRVKDCVQINTTEDKDADEIQYDFAQITAIFVDPLEEDLEMSLKIEVRWFEKPEAVRLFKSKK